MATPEGPPVFDPALNIAIWRSKDGCNCEVPIRIENLVYTCVIATSLSLNWVVKEFKHLGAQLNKKRFAAVIVRYRNPKIAILMFAQGKIVCTGAKNRDQARYMVYNTVRELRQIGYKNAIITTSVAPRLKDQSFAASVGLHIQNMVASVTLPYPIQLTALAVKHSAYCTYDPDLFPGAIVRYTPIDPMTVLVFRSGKMVVTGAKSQSDVLWCMDEIYPLIKPFFIIENKVPHVLTDDPFVKPVAQLNTQIRQEKRAVDVKTGSSTFPTQSVKSEDVSKLELEKILDTIFANPPGSAMKDTQKKKTAKGEETDDQPVKIQHMPTFENLWNVAIKKEPGV